MKRVDVWETIAAVAMHVGRCQMGDDPSISSQLGAYTIANTVARMNRCAVALHRLETERVNGFRAPGREERYKRLTASTEKRLSSLAASLRIQAEVEDMGYVTLTAGAFRLGCLPFDPYRER